jgi:hypothetical protein
MEEAMKRSHNMSQKNEFLEKFDFWNISNGSCM